MPHFDRFDICVAWWLYAMHYHEGQDSKLYRVFGRLERIGFRTLAKTEDIARLPEYENVRAIYNSLVERKVYQGKADTNARTPLYHYH